MRYAIVSDIHANLPAWSAVLNDIAREGVDGICCLGDVVGYGPRPGAVLASVRQHCENVVLGNHDAVIAGMLQASDFNRLAREAIEWTRERLGEEGREYFANVPLTLRGDGILLTHGDAAQPAKFRYVTKPEHARASFKASKRDVLFFGHTHQPGVLTASGSRGTINKLPARDMMLRPGVRYMINPGSVGDPRCSSDLRASYCIYDSKTLQLRFRRVEFDVDEYRRDFAASGLVHKPFFLRILDAESMREGEREGVVADHREKVDAHIADDRGARLQVGGAPVYANWDHSRALALAEAAKRNRPRSNAGVLWSIVLLLATCASVLLFWPGDGAMPRVENSPAPVISSGDADPVDSARSVRVTPVSTASAVKIGSDLELIMADEGWENPNGIEN
jgi:putative phosphoesterase